MQSYILYRQAVIPGDHPEASIEGPVAVVCDVQVDPADKVHPDDFRHAKPPAPKSISTLGEATPVIGQRAKFYDVTWNIAASALQYSHTSWRGDGVQACYGTFSQLESKDALRRRAARGVKRLGLSGGADPGRYGPRVRKGRTPPPAPPRPYLAKSSEVSPFRGRPQATVHGERAAQGNEFPLSGRVRPRW